MAAKRTILLEISYLIRALTLLESAVLLRNVLHRPHQQRQRQKLVLHDDIDSGDININPTGPNKVANKDSYEACVQDS